VPRRQYDAVVKDLKPIYTAIDADTALLALEAFEEKWGKQLPVIGQAWRSAWEYVTPFMAFEPEVRRVIYTTRSRRSTANCAKRSRPRVTPPARTPPASSSTSRSKTRSRSGPGPAPGRRRCWRSKSTSETGCPTNHQPPPTQLDGYPRSFIARYRMVRGGRRGGQG
jgi:hypothetical protein